MVCVWIAEYRRNTKTTASVDFRPWLILVDIRHTHSALRRLLLIRWCRCIRPCEEASTCHKLQATWVSRRKYRTLSSFYRRDERNWAVKADLGGSISVTSNCFRSFDVRKALLFAPAVLGADVLGPAPGTRLNEFLTLFIFPGWPYYILSIFFDELLVFVWYF